MLMGRHHLTAERLVTARGSAGRVHLKVGNPTRLVGGQPVWSISDATALVGSPVAASALSGDETVDIAGTVFVTLAGMRALLKTSDQKPPTTTIHDIADGDGPVRIGDLAASVGVSDRYLRKVCASIVSGEASDDSGLRPAKRGRAWTVDRAGALRWAAERKPPAVRVGYDLTLTTEKSLSVFGLLNPDIRDTCVSILRDANAQALGWLERTASNGRANGVAIKSHGQTVASFMHSTSRNDDPFMHIHNVVINAIVDKHGTGRTLDATGLFAQAPAAAALATASMRRALTERFGVDWRLSGRDTWEIDGIDDVVLEGFSSRVAEIESALAEMFGEDADDHAGHEVSASTRRAKTGRTAAELTIEWQQQAASLGYDNEARRAVFNRRSIENEELDDRQRAALWRWLVSPDGVCANEAVFKLGDVFWAIANWAPCGRLALLTAEQIIAESKRWLDSEHAILLDRRRTVSAAGRHIGNAEQPAWTTQVMVELQHTIAAVWADGRTTGTAQIDRRHVDAALAASDITLSDEQQDLVRSWVHSGHAIQAAIGRPGTGKTTTMRVAVDAWQRAGFRVRGAAVKGEAARILGKEAGVESNTVAHYLASYRRGHNPLDARTVLIVDEASTVPDWDLAELIAMTTQAGAALRLIGDPAQHASVQAGGSWERQLTRFSIDTPELKNQRRLTNPIEVEATELIRDGEFEQALRALDAIGHMETFASWEEAHRPLIERWWTTRQQGHGHPLVERTNARRQVLNSLAQALRVKAGEVSPPIQSGAKRFGVGDEVIARQPARAFVSSYGEHVHNGSTGVITKITNGTLFVDFDEDVLVATE